MIVVHTSVWIDYFNGVITAQTDTLDTALCREEMLVQRLGVALEGKSLAWCSVSDWP
jgi:hypothetical protein